MSPLRRQAIRVSVAMAAVAVVAGCGMKGPLRLPEKSQNVVIRDKQTGTTVTNPPATTAPERLPPPELPRTDSSRPRG
jgi:predicted small lipoprotein YifL